MPSSVTLILVESFAVGGRVNERSEGNALGGGRRDTNQGCHLVAVTMHLFKEVAIAGWERVAPESDSEGPALEA